MSSELRTIRKAGKILKPLEYGLNAYEVYDNYGQDVAANDPHYSRTTRSVVRIASGAVIGVGMAAGLVGIATGAAIAAPAAALLAVGGALTGYAIGDEVGGWLGDAAVKTRQWFNF